MQGMKFPVYAILLIIILLALNVFVLQKGKNENMGKKEIIRMALINTAISLVEGLACTALQT